MVIDIVLAEDHSIVRGELRSLLHSEPDMRVVGEAKDGIEALRLAEEYRPDVLLADVEMPGPDGIEVTRKLQQSVPETRVLIFTVHEDDCLRAEASEAGAWGVVPKRVAATKLIEAIRSVAGGYACWGPERGTSPDTSLLQGLNPNTLDQSESELLRLLVQSRSNAQIAETLKSDLNELKQRQAELLRHLGLDSRVQLVRYAMEQGLV